MQRSSAFGQPQMQQARGTMARLLEGCILLLRRHLAGDSCCKDCMRCCSIAPRSMQGLDAGIVCSKAI